MSASKNQRRSQHLGMQIAPVLSLVLGLCLQPVSSSAGAAEAASADGQVAKQASVAASPRQQVAPLSGAQARPAKRKNDVDRRMRQALEQVASERDVEKRAQKIRDLLARAQLDYMEGRVFEPVNDNAVARYKEVLALDPAQPQALESTRHIADILAAEAEHVALAGDQPRTLQYILQVRALQPNHPSLQGLDARYQALLASPIVLSARQQDRYARSAQSIDAAYDVLKNQPLGLRAIDEVMNEYDRAAGLVAQAPGLPKLKDRIILAFPAATRAELTADAPRQALRVVKIARKRGWFTPELGPLEQQAKQDIKAQGLFGNPVQQQ